MEKLNLVATGGTFDCIHIGHIKLLSTAFDISDHVIIGLTSDRFVKRFKLNSSIKNNYRRRLFNLKKNISLNFKDANYTIIKLEDEFGPVIHSSQIQAIVVSEETCRVAELLAPWRVRILACDPYVPDDKFVRSNAQRVSLEALLTESDVVTLHCNFTPETQNLIDAARLALMKPSAVLVNTARGRIVDLDALTDALERGALAAAALDVLPEEPPPAGSRLLTLGDRVLLMPHMVAANEGGTLGAAIPLATAAVLAALRAEVPEHVCNSDAIAAWRARFGGRPLGGTL